MAFDSSHQHTYDTVNGFEFKSVGKSVVLMIYCACGAQLIVDAVDR